MCSGVQYALRKRKEAFSRWFDTICTLLSRGGGEMVDTADLKSAEVIPRVGSNPTRPIDANGPS